MTQVLENCEEAAGSEAIQRRGNAQEATATTQGGQRSKGEDHIRLQEQWAPPETGAAESHLSEIWEGRAAATYILILFCLGILPVRVTSSAV